MRYVTLNNISQINVDGVKERKGSADSKLSKETSSLRISTLTYSSIVACSFRGDVILVCISSNSR